MGLKPITTTAAVCAAALLALGACDRQADKPARADNVTADTSLGGGTRADRKAERKAAKRAAREGRRGGDAYDNADAADSAPVDVSAIPASVKWASNRKNSAQEQVAKQFRRNGADFGATSAADYAAKASAFVTSPPRGTKTATRGNGDKLYYDPASNTFAVVNRRGLPKTMFKPDDGATYWQQQLAELDNYGKGRRQARRGGADADPG
jgi:pyocin large subunit-like protein